MTSYIMCKTRSLDVFKVTVSDQGHYKGPSGAFVTYCNISCFVEKMRKAFAVQKLLTFFQQTYWHNLDIDI